METKALAVQAKKTPDQAGAECWLYGDIGDGIFSQGVTAESFRAAIDSLGEFTSLTMYVNSPGGSVFDGKAIVAQIDRIRQRAKVTAVIDGLAASAASFVVMAADKVVMHPTSKMMIHLPHAVAAGTSEDMRKMAELLDSETTSLVEIYQRKTKLKAETIRSMLEAETWMTAEEAVSQRFADSILEPPKVKAEIESPFRELVARTQALTRDEVERRAALSRATRVVETLRASSSRNQ